VSAAICIPSASFAVFPSRADSRSALTAELSVAPFLPNFARQPESRRIDGNNRQSDPMEEGCSGMIDERSATPADPADRAGARKPELSIVVDGRYVLEERLGDGGMGVVYRARDQLMESHQDRDPYVAVKLINESLRNDSKVRTLLQRECSRAQKLSHPNIIRVFYFGLR
jgi:hypothetical protein